MRLSQFLEKKRKMTDSIISSAASAPPVPFRFKKFNWPSAALALESLQKREPQTLIHGAADSVKAFFDGLAL